MSNFIAMSSSIKIIRCEKAVPSRYLADGSDDVMRFPPADICINGDMVQICVEVPGVEAEDLSIYIFEHFVVIEGVKSRDKRNINNRYLMLERQFSEFRRIFKLPFNPKGYKTELADGVLHLTLHALA